MSNSEARKGQSLEQSLSETLEPVSHCASDCVACRSIHRLLYDQTHVLRGSLVFMEPHIVFRCARSIQTNRRYPRYSPLWVGSDRQILTLLGYRPGTRQIWSRVVFNHPYSPDRQIKCGVSYSASLLFRYTQTLRRSTGQFYVFPHLCLSSFHLLIVSDVV